MEDSKVKKRPRDESEEDSVEVEIDSPEVKKLRENLLEDDEVECCAEVEDLDFYMRSFEEEIRSSPAALDVTSDSCEKQPVLGYLLEASDDELGLPPTTSSSPDMEAKLVRAESESSELGGETWGFDGEIPGYDQLMLGIGEAEDCGDEFAVLDGLFELSDFASGDFAWRPETLPT
ncbi:uncharacterized protein [Primulina huaijiensis]|uniref:uncharacterized protein n=1 Tax=Primulina huaijiensis TaxID=1492673 RepID=UPI003CC78ECD